MYVFVFNRPDDFPEIRHFLVMQDARYRLGVDAVDADFKDGLRAIVERRGVKAIFLGTRKCAHDFPCMTSFTRCPWHAAASPPVDLPHVR